MDVAKCKKTTGCTYHVNDDGSVEFYPHGPGFGTVSFTISGNKIDSDQDLTGKPDIEKYKVAVRRDVSVISDLITIKEDSWNLSKAEYPWTVIY